MGLPAPAPIGEADVRVRIGDAATVVRVGRTVDRFTLPGRPQADGTLLVRLDAPTWNLRGEPAEQGVRVDRVAVVPVRSARNAMVRSTDPR